MNDEEWSHSFTDPPEDLDYERDLFLEAAEDYQRMCQARSSDWAPRLGVFGVLLG